MSEMFKDLCGILTAIHSLSLEEMERAISEQAQARFINAVESFSTMLRGEYVPIEHLWDDKP